MGRRVLPILIALVLVALLGPGVAGDGAYGFLARPTVAGNTGAQLWVSTGNTSGWLFVERQGAPTQPTSFDFGDLLEGSTGDTGLSYFAITNNGANSIDVQVSGSNMTGGTSVWVLSDTSTPGVDIYGLKAGLAGGSFNTTVKRNSPYNYLVAGLGSGASQSYGLKIWAPTTMSSFDYAVSGNITLTISLS